MTEPMVPLEVDLRGLPWMRLDTSRLLDSDLFALSTGDEFKAAVALWCKAWTQAPAGSLPTDDRILAHLSGAGARWKKVKAMALRGWVLCDDGRLYHPVVAEQALAAWAERQEYRAEVDSQNARKRKEREDRAALFDELQAAGYDLPWNTSTKKLRDLSRNLSHEESRTCHRDSHGVDGTGRDDKSFSSETTARREVSEAPADDLARALHGVGFPDCSATLPDLIEAKREGVTPQELEAIARQSPGKPLAYVIQTARGKRRDAAARAAARAGTAQATPTVDPRAAAEAEARRACDDEILLANNDLSLGLIEPERRDQRIADAQAKLREVLVGLNADASRAQEAA